jgi:ERCC4-type nuclease
MEIILEIDYREHDIIERLNAKPELTFTNKNLLIGDFIFRNKTDEILLIVERKTIKDLCASIIDSRFREQKERLIESVNDPSKIVYILEGSRKNLKGKGSLSKTIINSAIQNLIFKHQFKVLFTESADDTVDQLSMLYKKLKEESFIAPAQAANLIKKSSKIIDNIYINQLSVIPGVSLAIANKISEHYPSLVDLITEYIMREREECFLLLADIRLSEKRKLGKSLSKKIYECLLARNTSRNALYTADTADTADTVKEDNASQDNVQDVINVKLNCVL